MKRHIATFRVFDPRAIRSESLVCPFQEAEEQSCASASSAKMAPGAGNLQVAMAECELVHITFRPVALFLALLDPKPFLGIFAWQSIHLSFESLCVPNAPWRLAPASMHLRANPAE